MRTTVKWVGSILLLVILFNTFLIRKNNHTNEIKDCLSNIQQFIENSFLDIIRSLNKSSDANDIEIENEQLFINHDTSIINTATMDTLMLSSVLDRNTTIIVLFSSLDCFSCNSFQFDLNKFIAHFGVDNVIVITYHDRLSDIYIYEKILKINSPIYKIDQKYNNSIILDHNIIFTLDSGFKVSYIINMNDITPNTFEMYLKKLKTQLSYTTYTIDIYEAESYGAVLTILT